MTPQRTIKFRLDEVSRILETLPATLEAAKSSLSEDTPLETQRYLLWRLWSDLANAHHHAGEAHKVLWDLANQKENG